MEAVVKSLDPNSTASREIVLDSATEMIGYVVKTYVLDVRVGQNLIILFFFQVPDCRLPYGNTKACSWYERRRRHHVRSKNRDPALCS